MKLKIFTMGGTIDKIYFDDMSDYEVGPPQAAVILDPDTVGVANRVGAIHGGNAVGLVEDAVELLGPAHH